MNNDEARQHVLQVRLAANKQRLARHAYLASLPARLRSDLTSCTFLQSPAIDALKPLFSIATYGIGPSTVKPRNVTLRSYQHLDDVVAAIHAVPSAHDTQDGYFWPDQENPIYIVAFGWVRQHFHALWSQTGDDRGVMTVDQAAGMLISPYTLHHSPSEPDTIAYDVAVWHPLR